MRIRLEATDRDPFWIIGDPALNERDEMSLALSERVQLTRNQQAVGGAEWEAQQHFDRRNQRLVLTANVRYEFESEWVRMDFLKRLAATDPAEQLHRYEGDAWLRLDAPGTNEFKEWKLAEVVIGIAGTDLQGAVALLITYTVSAGGFSGDTHEGAGSRSLTADGVLVGPPTIDFFADDSGGPAIVPDDPASGWSLANEADPVWLVWFTCTIIEGGVPTTYNRKLSFGGAESGYTNFATAPIKDHLAAIAAELNPDYITAEVLTVSGRQCLRVTMARASEAEGGTPVLQIRVDGRFGGTFTPIAIVGELESRPTVADVLLTDANGVSLIADGSL